MATAIQKITLSPSRDIPFNKLTLSQANVRRIKAGISIEELAESIARQLMEKFRPERVEVTTDGRMAYAEATGAVLDGIRIDSMRLRFLPRSE